MSAVLIVDDDASHRFLARRALKRLACDLLEAESLTEARGLLAAAGERLKLVVLDLNLAGESGLDLLREIRAAIPADQLPVVIFSTSSLERDVREGYAAGANCYLVKNADQARGGRDLAAAAAFFLNNRNDPSS